VEFEYEIPIADAEKMLSTIIEAFFHFGWPATHVLQ
jgi:CYTH domain-containing protein